MVAWTGKGKEDCMKGKKIVSLNLMIFWNIELIYTWRFGHCFWDRAILWEVYVQEYMVFVGSKIEGKDCGLMWILFLYESELHIDFDSVWSWLCFVPLFVFVDNGCIKVKIFWCHARCFFIDIPGGGYEISTENKFSSKCYFVVEMFRCPSSISKCSVSLTYLAYLALALSYPNYLSPRIRPISKKHCYSSTRISVPVFRVHWHPSGVPQPWLLSRHSHQCF